MSLLHRIGALSMIPAGEGRNVDVVGLRIAVFHAEDGRVYATQASCPHRGGPLADGLVGRASVVCPLHDRVYDLRSGAGLNANCRIAVYPVRVERDGTLLLSLEPHDLDSSTGLVDSQ